VVVCHDERRTGSLRRAVFLVVAVAVGCGPLVGDGTQADDATTTGDSPGPVSATLPTTGTTTSDTVSTSAASTTGIDPPSTIGYDTEATSAGFTSPLPDFGPWFGCDVWDQDCPEGQKCLAFGWDSEDAWDETRCSPVAVDPGQLGDPCTVEESNISGIDDCDLGLMCFYVAPSTLTGVCVQQCEGSESDPICDDASTACLVTNGAPLALCLPRCDPLHLDCDDGSGCVPGDQEFVCAPVHGAAYGEACEYTNSCAPGLACVEDEFVPGCVASGCCTAYCDLTDEDADLACPQYDGGERCVPWFEKGNSPPQHADVGICIIPPG
jgi:hypothetical protein